MRYINLRLTYLLTYLSSPNFTVNRFHDIVQNNIETVKGRQQFCNSNARSIQWAKRCKYLDAKYGQSGSLATLCKFITPQ